LSESQDFYSFEEALHQLRLKEEELRRLVSEGEIRAFREGDTMKLRRGDVEHLKSELMGGEVVDFGDSGEDLVFEDDFEDPGMATEELVAAETLIDDELEVLVEETIEIEVEEELEELAAAPIAPPVKDDPLVLAASIVTFGLLILAGPVMLSASTGNLSELAELVAGIFVEFGA
jgi:excisionase family DNA binding protein